MPCGWEGNRRHGVALHGHVSQTSVVSPPTAHGLKKGYEYPACTHLNGTANFIFIFCSGFVHYFRVRHFPVSHFSACYIFFAIASVIFRSYIATCVSLVDRRRSSLSR